MSRYIDVDALNKFLFNGVVCYNPSSETDWTDNGIKAYSLGWCDAIRKIQKHTPTVDVRENVRGEWKDKEVFGKDQDDELIVEEWQSARCSKCGLYHTTPYMYYFQKYNYCPNCGADMRENLIERIITR